MMLVGRVVVCAGLLLGILCFAAGAEHAAFLFGSTLFVGIGNGLRQCRVRQQALCPSNLFSPAALICAICVPEDEDVLSRNS